VSLSHVDEAGRARMVDVGGKPESERVAVAEGQVRMSREAFDQVAANAVAKGDVLAVAEVAGVMAAKRTGELIPLCHPIGLDVVTVEAAQALLGMIPHARYVDVADATHMVAGDRNDAFATAVLEFAQPLLRAARGG